ncbi:hypothetical protein L3081_07305 [Colwellia sp. MSW7]|uniref:Uncharacterized protein n=1 Tax=Colwellia maritima TaxID=2912588 RepID=A0ABS9WZ29_9GAMM|nr:hypothetical protein [Colwellia maritima]MCI2283238.1 hypothetical protein [Colwellia maritima]
MTLTGINKVSLSMLASAILYSLYATPALSATQLQKNTATTNLNVLPKSGNTLDNNINDNHRQEIIQVIGRRNQANSEMSTETEQLMSVAGIGNDPLSAIYSLPGIVYLWRRYWLTRSTRFIS